jgi:phosphate/sulfate permease
VNFLNSAVGSKTASFRVILAVAALGIIIGCTFSSGMMEVARKGIFNPGHFYFSEIILIFLAVMVTDIILLDTFNSFGMPTSTTVSIVFELLGAATAYTFLKIAYDSNALEVGAYINSGKALAIIAGILLSVVVAFTAGVVAQYLTRLLFSFDYKKSFHYFGAVWGGFAIAAITYFMLVKGAKGASFITKATQQVIDENTGTIILASFIGWTLILGILSLLTKVDILKGIVLIGTFSLAMAFAGNDLVNFIGVPLAGYNAYELFVAAGGQDADKFLMTGLASKVATPTYLLLLAGLIMSVTLWRSSKARSVIKTSLDLGRQRDGYERFNSFAASRSLVRNFSKAATFVGEMLPDALKEKMARRFDQRPFTSRQARLGAEAPAFDRIRAATTLVVASILISIGTAFKLPLSTTYVTFMVFMGTSLADGAWGRESAVYRVSGVLSVVGGWFFTAFSAFTAAFVIAVIFFFGGNAAIVVVLGVAGFVVFHTHRFHVKRVNEQLEIEKTLMEGMVTKADLVEIVARQLDNFLERFNGVINGALDGLETENLQLLNKVYKVCLDLNRRTLSAKDSLSDILDRVAEEDLEAAQFYVLAVDYINEMSVHAMDLVRPSLQHIDNSHKALLAEQIEELRFINNELVERIEETVNVLKSFDGERPSTSLVVMAPFGKQLRKIRKNQIRRIREREIGTRNSQLFLSHLGEFRNLAMYTIRLLRVYEDLILEMEVERDLSVDDVVNEE